MGDILPILVVRALSIGIFAMFISIVFSAVFNHPKILPVIALSAVLSCVIYYVPQLSALSDLSCVICGVVSSIFGAIFFPITENSNDDEISDSEALAAEQPCLEVQNER